MVDGIGFGEHTLLVALRIDATGKKLALAIREDSTENSVGEQDRDRHVAKVRDR